VNAVVSHVTETAMTFVAFDIRFHAPRMRFTSVRRLKKKHAQEKDIN